MRVKGIRDRIDEDGEEEEAFAVAGRRALEFRRCGRELFVRMLASGERGWVLLGYFRSVGVRGSVGGVDGRCRGC